VERFELDVDKGAWVQDVNPGGPAEQSGIQGGGSEVSFQARAFRPGGDVITKVDGKPVEDSSQLAELISAYEPGDEVPVEVHRDGETQEIEVKLGERPLGRVGG
jgi:S1-C subfamily serine protease